MNNYRIKWILLLMAMMLFTSCTSQPKPSYYFPVMDLSIKRYFASEIQTKKEIQDKKYHQRARQLLLKSGYFKRLASYTPYAMQIEYNQYIHTSVLEVLGQALNPINAIFGVDVECSVEMQVTIKHHGQTIERYSYKKDFKTELERVTDRAKLYFDEFIEQLMIDMIQQSKIKRKNS